MLSRPSGKRQTRHLRMHVKSKREFTHKLLQNMSLGRRKLCRERPGRERCSSSSHVHCTVRRASERDFAFRLDPSFALLQEYHSWSSSLVWLNQSLMRKSLFEIVLKNICLNKHLPCGYSAYGLLYTSGGRFHELAL